MVWEGEGRGKDDTEEDEMKEECRDLLFPVLRHLFHLDVLAHLLRGPRFLLEAEDVAERNRARAVLQPARADHRIRVRGGVIDEVKRHGMGQVE